MPVLQIDKNFYSGVGNLPLNKGNADARVLGAGAETITPPTGASGAIFCADADVYIQQGGTAVVPVGDVTDGTAAFLIPAGTTTLIRTQPAQGLSVIASGGAAVVTILWIK